MPTQDVNKQVAILKSEIGRELVDLNPTVVAFVQQELKLSAKAFYTGLTDGKFGEATQEVLQAWRDYFGIRRTGPLRRADLWVLTWAFHVRERDKPK